MVGVDESKRLIPHNIMRLVAEDAIQSMALVETCEEKLEVLTACMSGIMDAHCVLLQQALCIHCKHRIPLVFIPKWGEWMHDGDLKCIASRASDVMGIDHKHLHEGYEDEDENPVRLRHKLGALFRRRP